MCAKGAATSKGRWRETAGSPRRMRTEGAATDKGWLREATRSPRQMCAEGAVTKKMAVARGDQEPAADVRGWCSDRRRAATWRGRACR
jgi:hypothetical protein